jgi:hypothetical protein
MVEKFQDTPTLLQYTAVVALAIAVAGTLTKAGETFLTRWEVGDYVLLSNAGLNNGLIIQLTDVTDTVLTCSGLSITGVALQAETIDTNLKQIVYTPWRNVSNYNEISSVINASQNMTAYMEQSFDRSTVCFSKTQNVVGGTAKADTDTLYATYARMKYLNGAVTQTTFMATFAGRYKV